MRIFVNDRQIMYLYINGYFKGSIEKIKAEIIAGQWTWKGVKLEYRTF